MTGKSKFTCLKLVHHPRLQAGTYLEEAGAAGPCEDCAVAKFLSDPALDASKHDNGTEDCKRCGQGFYADSEGMAQCTACVAGKYMAQFIDGPRDSESDCTVSA